MKKTLTILFLVFLLINNTYAADDESTLPPCQGEDYTWTDCFGTFTDSMYMENETIVEVVYVGEWKYYDFSGQGIQTFTIKGKVVTELVGEFEDGYFLHGQASITSDNGDQYVGGWKDNKSHGQGTFTYADGATYVGEYKDDKRNGQGTYTWADGDKETGKYINNEEHGSHKYVYADGRIEKRKYKNGKRIDNLKEKSNTNTGSNSQTQTQSYEKGSVVCKRVWKQLINKRNRHAVDTWEYSKLDSFVEQAFGLYTTFKDTAAIDYGNNCNRLLELSN